MHMHEVTYADDSLPLRANVPGHRITDTSTFRKRLKNVLFDRAYH